MSRLEVVGLSVVKNEGDVIEAFVRHNLQYLDYLFVLDNGSIDETGTILLKLRLEGLPVWSFDDSVPAHAQSKKISCLLSSIQSLFRPNFAVFLDVDEFIRCPSRTEFTRLLSGIQHLQCGLVPLSTFVRTPSDNWSGHADVLRTFRYRRRLERPPYYKCILRTDGIPSLAVRVAFGSHSIMGSDGHVLPGEILSGCSLAHFPVRSVDQFTTRCLLGWTANLLRNPAARLSEEGYQKRDNFDRIIQSGGLSESELPTLSYQYAQDIHHPNWNEDVIRDPMDFQYEIRYPATVPPPLIAIAKSLERIAINKPFDVEAWGSQLNEEIRAGFDDSCRMAAARVAAAEAACAEVEQVRRMEAARAAEAEAACAEVEQACRMEAAHAAEAEAQAAHFRGELDKALASRSWKITRPLRDVSAWRRHQTRFWRTVFGKLKFDES